MTAFSQPHCKIDQPVNFPHCTFTVPSDEALMMCCPSGVKHASFTNDEWPVNSFKVLPDLSSWILKKKTAGV